VRTGEAFIEWYPTRRSLIEVQQGNDYEKNTLNLVCKQSVVVWVRGTLKVKAKCLRKCLPYTVQHGSDRFREVSKGYPCLIIWRPDDIEVFDRKSMTPHDVIASIVFV
jgi:hypothetical protein